MLKTLLTLAVLLPSPLLAQSLWQEGGAMAQTVAYACDNAFDDLTVAYFTAADGTSFAALQIGGHVHAMVQEVSGSGVRYGDIDTEAGYVLHSKGDGLLLLRRAPGGGTDEDLLASCHARG